MNDSTEERQRAIETLAEHASDATAMDITLGCRLSSDAAVSAMLAFRASSPAVEGDVRLREAAQHMVDAWQAADEDAMEMAEANLRCALAGKALTYETLAAAAPAPPASQTDEGGGGEPFGYWVEQKHAEPCLLRKPAYIPEPSDLRTVTPLYATPPAIPERGEVAIPNGLRATIKAVLVKHRGTGESEEVIARDITTAVRCFAPTPRPASRPDVVERETIAEALLNTGNRVRYHCTWEEAKASNNTWVAGCYEHADAVVAALSPVREGVDAQGDLEAERARGQAEGFAAAVSWLRGRSAMKPRASLWAAAETFADQMEQSRIPGAALTPTDEHTETKETR